MASLDKNKNRYIKRKRIRGFLIAIVIELLTTPLLAYVIHQCVKWLFNLISNKNLALDIDFNYLKAWQGVLHIPGCSLWWLLLHVGFIFFLSWILLKPKVEMTNVAEIAITDKIKIPCAVGNGQYGSVWFLTEKEKDKLYETFIYTGDQKPKTRTGVVVEMIKKGNKEYIRYVNTPSSSIILGATRSGKTRRLLLETIWLQMIYGTSIVTSDVKGELYHYTYKFAKKNGYDVYEFDLRYPRKSVHYNFFQPVIDSLKAGDKAAAIDYTWDLVSALVGESKGEPIWYNGETAALAASILAVCMEASTEKQKTIVTEWIQDYYSYIFNCKPSENYMESSEEEEHLRLQNEISSMTSDILCGYTDPYITELQKKKETLSEELLKRLEEIKKYDIEQFKNMANLYYFIGYMGREDEVSGKRPLTLYLETLPDNHPAKTVFLQGQIAADKTRSSFYTSALGTLRLFTNPNIAEMTSKSDMKLGDIGRKKSILYMMIPDEKETLYPIISLLIQQLYVESVAAANENGGRLLVPTDYDLDEVGNFPKIPILGPLITAGQSRGIRANLVLQDYQQLEKKYEKDADTIKSNCTTKIYLKSDNPKTLKEISEYLGKYTVEMTSMSSSANYNSSAKNDGSASASASSNLGGRELLTPSEVAQIEKPYALVMNGGKSCITRLPDLSEYKINKILGLGDENHNLKLIMEQEKERPERTPENVPLWGIWNKYKAMLEEEATEAKLSFLE